MQPTHCDITMGVYCNVIVPLLCTTFHEWCSDICTWKTTFFTLQIWAKLQVGDIQQLYNFFFEYFLCKLTFSFLQISAAKISSETRHHQLNENVDSISGFEMFSCLCIYFKVTFLIYLEWTVNSAMSVYLKFYIFQNGTKNIYETSHFRPNFATYKYMSMPPQPHT